jgi:hypothetical protein
VSAAEPGFRPKADDHILGEPGPESMDKARVGWMQYLAERHWILPLAHRTRGPISGALQDDHRDQQGPREAPVFELADLGLVDDLFTVVPALSEEIQSPPRMSTKVGGVDK